MSQGDPGGGSIERKKERDSIIIDYYNRPTTITNYAAASFYVSEENIPILTEFRRIAKREAGTRGFSQVLIKAMGEYNRRHGIGNPQLLITHYAKPEGPQPMRVLCTYCQGALTEGKIFCQKAAMWVPGIRCYSCNNNRLRKAGKR